MLVTGGADFIKFVFVSAFFLALAACGESKTAAQYLADAAAFEQAGDKAAAILQIKNAIQLEPDNRAARSKLGYLYLEAGDFASALKELERARKFGDSDRELNQSIVKSLIMLGEHEQAATELALHGDFEDFDWQRLQAMLDLHVGRYEDARDTFRKLLDAQPGDNEVRASLVASLLQLNEVDEAKIILNDAIQANVDNAGLWIIKGQLAVIDKQYAEAVAAYTRALEINPEAYAAMLGRIVATAGLGRYAEAESLLASLPKLAKDDVRVIYLRGVVAEGKKDIAQALTHYRAVVQVFPEHRESLQRLARIHFEAGETSRAIEYLQRLTALYPGNENYKKQLGAAKLAAGHLDSAFEELRSMEIDIDAQTDANLLALLGSAYSKQGQYTEGIGSLTKALELEPESTPIAIQLALSHLRIGEAARAAEVLEQVRTREPEHQTAKVLLIFAYATADPQRAQTLLAEEIAANPNSGLPLNIRGFLAMKAGEFAAARKDLNQAVKQEPNFVPPYFNLARIEMAEGNIQGAMNEIERVLEVDGENSQAFVALGELASRLNKPDLAVNYWQRAREYDPNAGTPRAALARHYRVDGQLVKAQELIDEAYRVAPYQPLVQFEYAQIYLLRGDSEGARPVIEKLAARFPTSLRILELQVALHRMSGDDEALTEALTSLISLSPSSLKTYQLLVAAHLRHERYEKAREVAKNLMATGEHQAAAHELLGDISFTDEDYPQAISAYERGFKIAPSSRLVLKLDQTERRQGKQTERLAQWYKQHPEDRAVRFQLAANTHAKGETQEAQKNFEALLEQNPDNPVVLNNLAWIYHEIGDPRSLEYAEKAHQLLPDNPEIMDTYAWILLGNGKVEQAIRLLNDAIARSPDNPDIRYHYAKALVEVGQQEMAIEELSAVLEEGKQQFTSMPEAQALLQSLRSGG